MGLTLRLVLLGFLALVPAFAIQAYDEYTLRRDREAEVHEQALQLATLTASELDRILVGLRNVMLAVSKAPAVQALDAEACVPYFASLRGEFPYLISLTAVDLAGQPRCRRPGPEEPLSFQDRGYFQEAMAGTPFVIGAYRVGRRSGHPELPFAVPMRAPAGDIIGVLTGSLDLNWLTTELRQRGYPDGGSVTVADRNGTIIAREPTPENFVGTRIPDAFAHLLTASAPGSIEVTSQDGTRRILGYVPVSSPPLGLYVSAGIPSAQAFAAVNAATNRGAIMLGIGLVLALATALAAGRIFIKRPVDRLLAAAEAWREGDFSVRTGLQGQGGEISRIGAVFDSVVDEVQRRAAALRESEERSRLAIEATGIGIWDVDPRTGIRRWTREFYEIVGLDPEVAPDPDLFSELIHPDDRDWVNEAYRRAYNPVEGGRYEAEFRIRRHDNGEERWVLTTGRITFDPAGKPLRGIGTVRDVTARRQADHALRDSEARLRSLADNLPNGMVYQITADEAGRRRFIFISEGVERILGYKSAQVLADATLLYKAILEEDLPALVEAEQRALSGESIFSAELRIRRADGDVRWFQLTSAPRTGADGVTVWDGVGLDITARKLAEQELRLVNDTLEQRVAERTEELAAANRQLVAQIEEREKVEATLRQMQRLEAVGQLTAGVAHDFNNLLTVVLGNLEFLERLDLDARNQRRLQTMRSAAERGAKLTSQLLAFSRRQRLEPRRIDLNETVSAMTDLLQSTVGGSLRLEVRLTPGLWPALVDPTQIELVILNLAINARDASQVGGTLTVETANVTVAQQPSRPEEPGPGDYVVISVADTGTGMTDEVRARIFEPFFTTKQVGKGSGLGLAQVYGFVKQSGGGIRIDTKVGQGTRIQVLLPRAASVAQVEPAGARGLTRATGGARGTILLVDDDPSVREVTATTLQDLGYVVLEAGSGGAALQMLAERADIDLLIVDFAMPGMNGAEVASAARAMRPALPVIFLTGYADFAALPQSGGELVVQKPYRGDDLSRKIVEALHGRQREESNVVPLKR